MRAACGVPVDAGVVRGVVGAVNCRTRDFAEMGYLALTGQGSPFQLALTLFLTLYVAVLGYRLLLAPSGARLSDAPVAALRIGAVLALVTNWSTFQTLVFDVTARAPVQIAGLLSQSIRREGSALVRDPVAGLQIAYDQLADSASAYARVAGGGPGLHAYDSGAAAAAQALSLAAGALFSTTAGLVAVATIAVGVLSAAGPLFIALFLFRQTRGLFAGWVRAMVIAALAPLGAWVLIVMELSLIEPWLQALADQAHVAAPDVQTALTAAALVMVFAAAQAALLAAFALVGLGFRLEAASARRSAAAAPDRATSPDVAEGPSRAQILAQAVGRLESGPRLGGASGLILARESTRFTTVVGQGRGERPSAPSAALGLGDYRRPSIQKRRTA